MTEMPELGWPDSLEPGALFREAGKTYKFASTANLIFMGEEPHYQGMAVWRDGPDIPKRRLIPAGKVLL
jgi:hypothetical protein